MSVDLMTGILQGFQASQERTTKISAARDAKRQKDEAFELDKKIKLLEIDKAEMMGALDKGAAEIERKRQKLESNLYDAQSEIDDDLIDTSLTKTKDIQESLRKTGNKAAQFLMPQRQRIYTPGKGFSNVSVPKAKAASAAVPAVDKVMGVLQSGGVMKGGGVEPFEDKQSAEAYANQNLGIGWEKKYPNARNMIDLNFGNIEDVLPAGTTKTSEAMKYLMDQRGLSDAAAAAWLRTKQQDKIKVK